MTAVTWIGELARYLGSWLPRPLIVVATHMAVKFVRGKHARVLQPGWHWYVPAMTEIVTRPVKQQTIALPGQPAITADGKDVAIGGIVTIEIRGPEEFYKAIVDCWEIDDVIRDLGVAVLNEFVSEKELAEICSSRRSVNTELTRRVRSALNAYGVYVIRAQLAPFGRARTLVHVTNFTTPDLTGYEEE